MINHTNIFNNYKNHYIVNAISEPNLILQFYISEFINTIPIFYIYINACNNNTPIFKKTFYTN